jgi:hypothetical protein
VRSQAVPFVTNVLCELSFSNWIAPDTHANFQRSVLR